MATSKENPGASGARGASGTNDQLDILITPSTSNQNASQFARAVDDFDIPAFLDRRPKVATNSPFQILPPLSDEDYQALKTDIAQRGVMVPVEYDRQGVPIDGHHRIRACVELGIPDWPNVFRGYADDAAKRTQARKLNLARRHLDQAARRALIEAELSDDPGRSNRQVARHLGVADKTVSTARKELESTAVIPQLEKTVGKDGKSRTARRAPTPSPDHPAGTTRAPGFAANTNGSPSTNVAPNRIRSQVVKALSYLANASVSPGVAVGLLRNEPNDKQFVDKTLVGALAWLNKFADEWPNHGTE